MNSVNTKLLKKPEAMIFDMDGTLFKTETLLIPAYDRLFTQLREEGVYTGETPPVERMLSSLGMVLDDLWERVLPGEDKKVHERADELLLENELTGLHQFDTQLYPGTKAMLEELKSSGVRLFVASNGLEGYVKGIADAHHITPLFEELYSAGQYQTASKVDLVHILLEKHGISSAWMVGDRSSDVEAGLQNGLTVIGCAYAGFCGEHELKGSHQIIQSFKELTSLYLKAEEQ
ncbi:phosphoglycolate phosphatase-like HAD superfamily hydrolase [Paenibacillus shirakamiensis]|uniref:Phosphoglycolate phosphatase-like HAD superfamily hydrolase n=1 Tax=Paenibacillus shirakamiensis TaxID=1265935 RepID=A0ABS4JLG7_9BACL|nr:HAD hydrolase-like protein [Paenibacillus shirakamiensis]MBP2002554.1 phosphoglycolate phosphatase-like HAD superfamily hydrolase [Paenibacillus shirakamiensis]